MKKLVSRFVLISGCIIMLAFTLNSCQKTNLDTSTLNNGLQDDETNSISTNAPTPANPNFNLEVILRGDGNAFGLVKFRQANDAVKIVTLDTWVRDLLPNHEYKLQRAVDTNLDGNCTGTAWLTLGKGLTPQSIFTDDKGTGREDLWRSLASVATGATFDIHFRVIDAVSSEVVLSSNCYQYTVR